MNQTKRLGMAVAAMLALALPVAAWAQQAPPGTVAPAPRHHGAAMRRAMAGLGLSDAQRAQIKQLRAQYRQAHPKGSPRDPQAARALRRQVLDVLTPSQRGQLRNTLRAMRQSRSGRPEPGPGGPDGGASPSP